MWKWLLLLCLIPHPSFAKYAILNEWTVELVRHKLALPRYQEFDLSGAVVSGDFIYIASGTNTFDKRLIKTGEKVWSFPLEGEAQSNWNLTGDQLFGGDTKGNFYCVDAKSGRQVWKAQTKGLFFSRALVDESHVYVMTSEATLQAYKKKSGEWLWQQKDPKIASIRLWSEEGPTPFQGLVVAGFPSGTLLAIDPQSGEVKWKDDFSNSSTGGESINDLKSLRANKGILLASSYNGNLRAYQAVSGSKKLLWEKFISLYAPATLDPEDENLAYVSTRDGKLQAIDLESGLFKWSYQVPEGLATAATVSNNHIWIGSSSGHIIVLNKDGSLLAKSPDRETSFYHRPIAIQDDVALFLSSSALLRTYKLAKIY